MKNNLLKWLSKLDEKLEKELKINLRLQKIYKITETNSEILHLEKYGQHQLKVIEEFKELKGQIKTIILPLLDKLLDIFKSLNIIIKKRQSKLLDYERAITYSFKSLKIDESLQESVCDFLSINDQLCKELPTFFSLVEDYIFVVFEELINLQTKFYNSSKLDMFSINMTGDFLQRMENCEDMFAKISLLDEWREKEVWPFNISRKTQKIMHLEYPLIVQCHEYFYPFSKNELLLKPKDFLSVTAVHGDEWSYGTSERGSGWFPSTHVSLFK